MPKTRSHTRSPKPASHEAYNGLTLSQARKLTESQPDKVDGWKALGIHMIQKAPQQALEALSRASDLAPRDPEIQGLLGESEHAVGRSEQALKTMQRVIELEPEKSRGHLYAARILHDLERCEDAQPYIDTAYELEPGSPPILELKAQILSKLRKYDEALATYEELLRRAPKASSVWNNAANIKRSLGLFDQADAYYKKAIVLDPHDPLPFSNRITTLHYRPDRSRDDIYSACTQWQKKFGPARRPQRPSTEVSVDRPLRIGMFSDGFHTHPVGWMITAMLESLDSDSIHILAYSSNRKSDHITARIKTASRQWIDITRMPNNEFAQRIRDDKIDILFDLSGHHSGTRMQAVTMEPAPIIIKWVGGLINTTGVSAFDYLLTDAIESPEGEQDFYSEKLIRMPDDYVCYTPPPYLPRVGTLPALDNGYVTLGCFNNPTKINQVVLENWADILHDIPGSHLLLKGHQYNSPSFCSRILQILSAKGIPASRVHLEEGTHHRGLFEAYNRVDIALDPWPYSGGLTTVEATLMGVPVITLPGPTFAGRHSATHLTNADMPELVVSSWAEYKQRVVGLANDLESLAIIRTRLRDIVLNSALCDGRRFAHHFTTAMRAVWQRYCDGKEPAALTIDKQGHARFEQEAAPVFIPEIDDTQRQAGDFQFLFKGKIVTVDNGGLLVEADKFSNLNRLKVLSTIVFDPLSRLTAIDQHKLFGEIHHYPHATLGNGNQTTLYACLDPLDSATLEPRAGENSKRKVIAKVPIPTVRLDGISGLERVDWLILDGRNDNAQALANGARALDGALITQIRIHFKTFYNGQPDLHEMIHRMRQSGLEFHCLLNCGYRSYFQGIEGLRLHQASHLVHADALFVANEAKRARLTSNERMKLAFILHSAYDIKDLTYHLLFEIDPDKAQRYLVSNNYLGSNDSDNEENEKPLIPDVPRMSEHEIKLFTKYVSQTKRYFEYGSGGSTKLAIKHGITVFGVESDANWVAQLRKETGHLCKVDHVDIGPTKEWGYPVGPECKDRFPQYSGYIDTHTEPFDFILVDGRFRVACALHAIMHTMHTQSKSPETERLENHIFIHDFWNRPYYHVLLQLLQPIERVDTAAVLKIRPEVHEDAIKQMLKEYEFDPR